MEYIHCVLKQLYDEAHLRNGFFSLISTIFLNRCFFTSCSVLDIGNSLGVSPENRHKEYKQWLRKLLQTIWIFITVWTGFFHHFFLKNLPNDELCTHVRHAFSLEIFFVLPKVLLVGNFILSYSTAAQVCFLEKNVLWLV